MATTNREQLAKQLLQTFDGRSRHSIKPISGKLPHGSSGVARTVQRRKYPHRLPSPTEEQLERREQGWNDRFACDTPQQPKRPQRNRSINDSVDAQDAKERKIRDERHHYGHPGAPKQRQRPGLGRLVPIAPLGAPAQESDTMSSKEERLRFNVLKAIDARETLIYQLNALILCTPVQEAIVMAAARASGGGLVPQKPRSDVGGINTMTNPREAMRIAHQLGTDLQLAGIQVVESIVEWMLEAGAKADRPPEFLWRGHNYFLKMEKDLDFAGPELLARGFELDCFSLTNPLCIRPGQRLGRVLAAQTIIGEMADMSRRERGQESERGTRKGSGDSLSRSPEETRPTNRSTNQTPVSGGRCAVDMVSGEPIKLLQTLTGADELIASLDERSDYEEEDPDFVSARSSNLANSEAVSSLSNALQDHESAKDLISILDESFSEKILPQELDAIEPQPAENSGESTARNQYENSFDDEPQTEDQDPVTLTDLTSEEPKVGLASEPEKALYPGDDNLEDDIGGECSDAVGSDDTFLVTETTSALETRINPGDVHIDWDEVAKALATSCGALNALAGSTLRQCALWRKEKCQDFEDVVNGGSWSSFQDTLSGSFLSSLDPALVNCPSIDQTVENISRTEEVHQAGLLMLLLEECEVVVDIVCAALARTIELDLKRISPLVSEVELVDIVEITETLLRRDEIRNALRWVTRAMDILRQLAVTQKLHNKRVSQGLSQLLQVFYPYIINQRKDKQLSAWRAASRAFVEAANIHFERLAFLMNGTCKVFLLNVLSLARNSEDNEDVESLEIPKLTIVCDRVNVLVSSVAAVSAKCFKTTPASLLHSRFQLYPFFRCSFGEKLVDGVTVEEGEGKGPLKEWFTLVAQDLVAKWRAVDLPVDLSSDEYDPVLANGNKLVVDRWSSHLKAGYKVEWRSPVDNTTISRIINLCDPQNGTYMLDRRGLSNHAFSVSELRVFQPRFAYLEYVQSSETYWLNESLEDTTENREVLEFCGWLFANALVHQCGLQLPIHRLLFELILHEDRTVTLEDLKSLDSLVSNALQQLTHMKPSEFVGYLEFEGLPSHWSVNEYIKHSLDTKYGPESSVGWQLPMLRRGFYRVFTAHDILSTCLSAEDLAELVSGESSSNSDFRFDQVFRVSLDPDFASCAPLRRCFWEAVDGFDPVLKRYFVKFVTGVDTLPQAGTEFLRIEMPFPATSPSDCEKTLSMLPQSHTCDNTLELPHYWRALCWKHKHDADQPSEPLERQLVVLLQRKLQQAAEYSSGYGLDGTKPLGGSLAGLFPGSHPAAAALDVQDSYESLDLPALDGDGEDAARESVAGDATATRPREEEEYGGDDWEEEA